MGCNAKKSREQHRVDKKQLVVATTSNSRGKRSSRCCQSLGRKEECSISLLCLPIARSEPFPVQCYPCYLCQRPCRQFLSCSVHPRCALEGPVALMSAALASFNQQRASFCSEQRHCNSNPDPRPLLLSFPSEPAVHLGKEDYESFTLRTGSGRKSSASPFAVHQTTIVKKKQIAAAFNKTA